jgi:hypothetical protein
VRRVARLTSARCSGYASGKPAHLAASLISGMVDVGTSWVHTDDEHVGPVRLRCVELDRKPVTATRVICTPLDRARHDASLTGEIGISPRSRSVHPTRYAGQQFVAGDANGSAPDAQRVGLELDSVSARSGRTNYLAGRRTPNDIERRRSESHVSDRDDGARRPLHPAFVEDPALNLLAPRHLEHMRMVGDEIVAIRRTAR